jgi:hypothetical protein
MRTLKFNFGIVISILIALSVTLTTVDTYGQKSTSTQSQVDQKKKEAIKKIKAILKETTYNGGGVKSILKIAESATLNFDTYVLLADYAHEFGSGTGQLVKLAEFASKTKFETDYFIQLADLSVMEAGLGISELAELISKQNSPDKAEIEKSIQTLKNIAHYKTLEEARAENKVVMDRITKQ